MGGYIAFFRVVITTNGCYEHIVFSSHPSQLVKASAIEGIDPVSCFPVREQPGIKRESWLSQLSRNPLLRVNESLDLGFYGAEGLEHLVVDALLCHQFLMITGLGDFAVLHYDDTVGVSDRGEAVGNDDHCASFCQAA